jgi:hypothetical protein
MTWRGCMAAQGWRGRAKLPVVPAFAGTTKNKDQLIEHPLAVGTVE